ncbi:MAG: hypothetical protein EXR91_08170 [Gemmatimonadetes bacterium]|nr:hypothetical protein [Gemmatimonadota bacterium]
MDDARKMHAIGGLAIVAGHTQIMRPGPRLDAIRTVADSARAQGARWIARAEDVADWWIARAEVRLTFVPPDDSGFRGEGFERAGVSDLLVEAPVDRGLDGLWVDLVLPRGSASMVVLVDGRSVDFAATEWGVRVPLPTLAPGRQARISLLVPTEGRTATP